MGLQNPMFRTPVHCFFRLFNRSKHGSSYRNDLRRNKHYFELAEGSSYRGFELPKVKLEEMYEGNPREIDFGSS